MNLRNLNGFTHLKELELGETKVTDHGLECLQGLTQFARLSLASTQVTDAGLVCLRGLATFWDKLDLYRSLVTKTFG